MREKLETLSLVQLKELAKGAGIKGVSTMRKAELIEHLVQHAEAEEAKAAAEKAAAEKAAAEKAAAEKAAAEKAVAEKAAAEKAAAEKAAAEKPAAEKPARERTARGKTEGTRTPGGRTAERRKSADRKTPSERKAGEESGKTSPEAKNQNPEKGQHAEKTERTVVKRPSHEAAGHRHAQQGQGTQEKAPHEKTPHERQVVVNPPEKQAAVNPAGAAPVERQAPERAGISAERQSTVAERTNASAERTNASAERTNASAERTNIPAEQREAASPDRDRKQAELQAAADQGPMASGILEVMQDGFGFIRCENYLPGDDDVYVSPSQIRRFNLKTGDIIMGNKRMKTAAEKFAALLYVNSVNGVRPAEILKRENFEDMTPIFPNERIRLAVPGATTAMRIVDLVSPIGKGQRGMIVSPPKAGKTTLLKQVAKVITSNLPDMHLIILLIDERPEEVTDIKEYIEGPQVEVIYSTFDEQPERHKRVSEMVIERAKRLVEQHRDVTILLDSITRLSRAYNLTITPSGRTLSGGLDPAALYMPKRFFGAARNMREGGSLTILATALIDTGSRMDDVVYEEFKGTGNMELVLDRKLSEKRIFPAIDILKSGTRRDDLLLSKEESEVLDMIHKATTSTNRPEDAVERILDMFARTANNEELIRYARYNRRI